MPYIKPEERGNMVQLLKPPTTPGQLNYLITSICLAYMRGLNKAVDLPTEDLTYSSINSVIGALECVKLEFYRRQAVSYEDAKKIENGDLPWLQS